ESSIRVYPDFARTELRRISSVGACDDLKHQKGAVRGKALPPVIAAEFITQLAKSRGVCSRAWVLARPIHDNRDDRPGSERQCADRCDRIRGTDQVSNDAGQECANRVTHVAP